jgi:hypothetical protein
MAKPLRHDSRGERAVGLGSITGRRQARVSVGPPTSEGLRQALLGLAGDRLNTALMWAALAGWPHTVLAAALDVSRQKVGWRIGQARYRPAAVSIPIPRPED